MKFFPLLLIAVTCLSLSAQDIILNEIMSSNLNVLYDEDGDTPDWIELFNNSSDVIDLSGYGLSDDTLNTQKWRFHTVELSPGEYKIVYASGKDRQDYTLHTNFKVNAGGECIFLSDTAGTIIDQVDVPPCGANISYARKMDGDLSWIFQLPTPGTANIGEEFLGYADSVVFSDPAGFYRNRVAVSLTAGESQIVYTLDGSEPDETSIAYSDPIDIRSTTVLRAIAYKSNYLPSSVVSRTYFIGENTDLPVISLSTDPHHLFDYNEGIFADGPGWTPNSPHHGANYWMDWEKPAHIEFFEEDESFGFSQNCGITCFGGWTRSFPQKSVAVKFKDDYNASAIEYPLFPGFDVTTFKSFVLRNSGNDFYNTHIRDALMQGLVKDLDIDYLEYRPATAFINGEYWGVYNIREKISEHYVANRYNVDPDNIDLLECNMEVIHGDSLHYQQLVDYLNTRDMSTDSAYQFIDRMIDLNEWLIYFTAQIYFNNRDWPGNNIKYWRERTDTGKWRWILYDLDFGFNLYGENGQGENHLTFVMSPVEMAWGNPPWATLLQRQLVKNPRIKNQFINQMADLLNTNFIPSRVKSMIDEYAAHIANEIDKHRQHWGINQSSADYHVNSRMKTFADERPGYVRDHFRRYFRCGDDCSITINAAEGGKVRLNTLCLEQEDLPWSGLYFQENVVHLKAIPYPGYKFDGWSGSIDSEDFSIEVSGIRTVKLTPIFSKDTDLAKDIVINEINYNSSDEFYTGDWVELYNRSSRIRDLNGWILSDSGDDHEFAFPEGTLLEPDQYLVIVQNDSAFTSRFQDVTRIIGEMDFGLSGMGELIQLRDDEDVLIDSLTYRDDLPWPAGLTGTNSTLELIDPNLDNSLAENWRASNGNGSPGEMNTVTTSIAVFDQQNQLEKYHLYQNYPNPFNSSTQIRYKLSSDGFVNITVYDISGRQVTVLVNQSQPKGFRQVRWNGTNTKGKTVSNGIYFYKLQTNEERSVRAMVLLK